MSALLERRNIPLTDEQEYRVIDLVKELLKEAKDRKVTGEGTLIISFNQGGITGRKVGLLRSER